MNTIIRNCILIICVSFLFNSCKSSEAVAEKYLTIDQGAIPPDFGKDDSILLVCADAYYFTKRKEKVMEDNYSGNYEFGCLYSTDHPYGDVDKYRYIFTVTTGIGSGTNSLNRPSTVIVISILDRKENKTYRSKRVSLNWFNFSKAYIRKLDQQRIANQR
jgi:hypothetical protein